MSTSSIHVKLGTMRLEVGCRVKKINLPPPVIYRGIESVPEKYKIPLLTLNNTGPLTISESIGKDGTVHRVSAQVCF